MPLDDLNDRLTAPTTRRTVVKTGAKLAYAAPLVAATMKLSSGGASAVSGPVAGCGSYYLADADGGCILVDDDMAVYVNGTLIFLDDSGVTSCNGPIPITAAPGSALQIRVTATDAFGICRSISSITLFCEDGSASQALTSGVNEGCDGAPGTTIPFFDETYTIGI